MRTLYEITDDMQALDALLDEIGGDVSDEDVEAAITAWFDSLDAEWEAKLDGYAAYIRNRTALAEARKAEAARMAALARRDENSVGWLKRRLMEAMQARQCKKLDTARFSISVCKAGGLPAVDIHDPASLPADCIRIIPERREPDTDIIRRRVSAGEEIPGVTPKPRSFYVRIK